MDDNKMIEIRFEKIEPDRPDQIAYLSLNRPESANAFNGAVLEEITAGLKKISETENVRVLILSGKGKHFSAGADLGWMKDSAKLSLEKNKSDAELLVRMFETLRNMKIPTIAVVNGAAFGGAVGLTACCDIAIALANAKFCLSEVKLGILPAVILPYLARKMNPGQLRRLGLSARVFNGEEALNHGLVESVVNSTTINEVLRSEINAILSCGPQAVAKFKNLLDEITANSNKQGSYCVNAIANARIGEEAQAGFSAFFAKKPTPWTIQLDENWMFNA